MRYLSGVVCFEASIKVFCESHVEIPGILFRPENVHVVKAHCVDVACQHLPNFKVVTLFL